MLSLQCTAEPTMQMDCSDQAPCPAGERCRKQKCAPADAEAVCAAAADCAGDEVCRSDLRTGGLCFPTSLLCTSHRDCPAGRLCIGGFCDPGSTACTTTADCPSGLLCDGVMCDAGARCHELPERNTVGCFPDECPMSCPSPTVCAGTECVNPTCLGISCPTGSRCIALFTVAGPPARRCQSACVEQRCTPEDVRPCAWGVDGGAVCPTDRGPALDGGDCAPWQWCDPAGQWQLMSPEPCTPGEARECAVAYNCPSSSGRQTCQPRCGWSPCR